MTKLQIEQEIIRLPRWTCAEFIVLKDVTMGLLMTLNVHGWQKHGNEIWYE